MIDDRNSPDLIFLHRCDRAGQIIILAADDDCVRHYIAHRRSIGISGLSYYFDGQVSIRNYSNYLFGPFITDHRNRADVFAPHHARGLTNRIVW